MEENQNPGQRLYQEPATVGSSESLDDSSLVSSFASLPQTNYQVDNMLEVHDQGQENSRPQVSAASARHAVGSFSKRKALVVSVAITVAVTLFTGASALILGRNAPKAPNDKLSLTTPVQDIGLENEEAADLPPELQGADESLLVAGDIITRGDIKFSNNSFVTVLRSTELTANQTFTLPNASGALCLDSNNCNYTNLDQFNLLNNRVNQLGQQLGQIDITAGVVTALNNQQGAITIQGTSNQISVTTANGVVTLATPQDLATVSSPTFANMLLTGNFTVNGIVDTGLDCTTFLNGGALTTNASGQLICADDEISGGGTSVVTAGGTAGTIPVFVAADEIADSIISQALGTITISGALNVTGAISGDSLTLTNALSVGNGGTGATSFTANGLLIGNGAGAVTSTNAAANGQVLLGNGTTPTFTTISGDVAFGGTGVTTIQANSVALGVDTTGNYLADLAVGNGLSVSGGGSEGATPTVSLNLQANKGLEVDANGLSLIDCGLNQVLKYNGLNQWACAADTDTTGSFSVAGDSGTPETVGNGDTLTIQGGNNISTTVGATDTVTIATVNNPSFTTSVTTPLLQSSGALSITPGGALTVGATGQTALLQGSTTTITSNGVGNDIVLTSADQIQLSGFNCTTFTNGGVLTTDASGNIGCANDDSAPANTVTGGGSANRLALFTGAQVVADSWLLQNGSTLELDNTRNLSLTGGNFSVTGTGLFTGLVTANGGITVEVGDTFTFNGEAFTDLTGTGLQLSSGSLQTTLGTSVDLTTEVTGILPVGNGGTGVNGSAAANGTLLIGNGTGYTLATLTAGSGITVNNAAGSIEIVNFFGTSIESGEITDLTITGDDIAADTIALGTKTTGNFVATIGGNAQVSVSGSGSESAAVTLSLVADSIGDAQLAFDTGQNLTATSSPTFNGLTLSGSLTVEGGNTTIGTAAQAGTLTLSDGSTHTGAIQTAGLGQNTTFTLPDPGAATASICLSTGNCAGAGGGVTTAGGTANRIALFNGAQTIADSWLLQNGSTLQLDNTRSLELIGGNLTLTNGNISITGNQTTSGTVTFSALANGFLEVNGSGLVSVGTIDLGTDTTGNYVATITNGNGITGSSAGEGGTPTIALGPLTADWVQSGAFDVVYDNAGAELRILESAGATFYGTFDVGDLSGNEAYTFLQGGTVVTSGNVSSFATTAVTAGNGLTGGGTTGALTLDIGAGNGITVNANDIAVVYGSAANTAVQGNTSITVSAGTNLTGGGSITLGAGGTVTLDVANSPTFSGTVTVQGSSVSIGTASTTTGSLDLYNAGSTFAGSVEVTSLGQATLYTLPDPGAATATICLSTGNCASAGGGVTTAGGSNNRLAKFTGAQVIADSTISDDGTNVTTSVDLIVQGGAVTVGTALQDGALTLYGNGFTAAISAALTGNQTYTLPDGTGEFCIKELANCSGAAGGNAPNSAQYLTLALDAGLTAERTLSFNGTNFSVVDNGANNSYTVNTAQNINTAATPSFAGLTLTGNLNMNANTIQGTSAVIDFTNFDVASTGALTAGTYNGQTISSAASFTGSLTVAGLTTLNGGLTVEAGDTLTFNGDAFTDLTGNGLQVSTNVLTLMVQANKGLEVDANGLSLIDCASGEVLKYNGSNQWACAADAGGTGLGDDVQVNGVGADGANFINSAATGTAAAITWTLNAVSNPDEITLSVGVASATEAGIITTGSQTFAGVKTFSGQIVANGGIDVSTQTISGTTATIDFTNFDVASNGNTTVGGTLGVTGNATLAADLTVDTNTLVLNSATDRIGVGIASPTARLDVQGNAGISSGAVTMTASNGTNTFTTSASITLYPGDWIVPDTTSAQSRVVSVGGTGTNFTVNPDFSGNVTAETFTIYPAVARFATTSGVQVLTVRNGVSGGKVGIGTDAPREALDVNGNIGVSANLYLGRDDPSSNVINMGGTSINILNAGNANVGFLFQTDNGDFSFKSNASGANYDTLDISGTTGASIFRALTDGADRLALQNAAAGTTIFTVNSSTAAVTLGAAGIQGSLLLHDGTGQTGTLSVANLAANRTYTLPEYTTGTGTICLDSGNCAGSGTGVTTAGGTTDRLAKFTGSQAIGDSSISDNGTLVSVLGTVDLTVQGGDVTLGTTSGAGSIILHDGNGQTTTITAGNSAGNLSFVFPTTVGSNGQCVKNSATPGVLTFANCNNGSGAGGSITLQDAYDAGNTIASTDNRNLAFTFSDTATDANFLVNLQCATCSANGGRFAVQNGGTDVFTVNPNSGGTLVRVAATAAFQVQNTSNNEVLTVNTTGNEVRLGKASTLGGKLVFNNASNANTVTIEPGTISAAYTLNLPNLSAGTYDLCTTSGNCAGAGSSVTQSGTNVSGQVAYFTNGSNITSDADFTFDGTNVALGGNLSVGGTTQTFTGASGTITTALTGTASTPSNAMTVTTGGTIGATSNTGALTLSTGAAATSGNTGGISILTGNATSGTAGNISINVGTSSTGNGSLLLGTAARAQTITIGNTTGSTTLTLQAGTGGIALGSSTLRRTAAGVTNLDLIDGANTTFAIQNSGAGVANVTIDGDLAVNGGDITSSAGTLNINTSGSGNTSIGTASGITTLNGLGVQLNTTIFQRQGAGSLSFDLQDGANTTLALNNSGAGVANLTVDGSGTFSGNLTVDTNTLFVDSSSNEVGIGTTSPDYKFDVDGTGLVAQFGNDPGVIAVGTVGASSVNAFLGGYYSSGGNVSTIYFGQNNYWNGSTWVEPSAADNTSTLIQQSGAFNFYTGTSGLGTARLVIENDGDVAIGPTTAGAGLDVQLFKTGAPVANLVNTNNAGTGNGLQVNVASVLGTDNYLLNVMGNNVSHFYVQEGGNVGVGDTTPAYLLTVGNGDLFGVNSSAQLVWEGTTADAFELTVTAADPTADRTYTIPNSTAITDTFCLLTLNNCAGTGDGGVLAVGTFSTTNTAAGGATITGTDIIFQSASASAPGMVDTGSQTFAGTKTFNGSVVLAASQSLTVTGGNTASRPGSPTEGMIYFDTDTDRLLTYSNGKWQATTGEYVIVAASNSSQAIKDAAHYVADGDGGGAGDGDQVQINAALTAASGGKVYLAPGTYVADATILIPNNTTLAGAGRGTLLELGNLDATDNLIENSDTSTGTGVAIQDIRLDGRDDLNTAGTQHGIYLSGMGAGSGAAARQGAKINNLWVNNFRSHGIYLNASSNSTLSGNTALANDRGFYLDASSSYNTLTGNNAQGNPNGGFYLFTAVNNTLTGNTSQGNSSGFTAYGASYNTFTGNTALDNTAGGFSAASTSTHNTYSGNTSKANSYGFTNDTDSAASHNSFVGNTVQGNTFNGFVLHSSNNTIASNKIHDNGGATANNGIQIHGDSNIITGNNITDTSCTTTCHAINIFAAAADTNYLADNSLGGGTINDAGTGTIYGGQLNTSGDFVIQPAGTIDLSADTYITGSLTVDGGVSPGVIALWDGSNEAISIQVAVQTGSYTATIPDLGQNDTFCFELLNNCAGTGDGGVLAVGTFSTTNTAAGGATITGTDIIFQSASASAPGMVDTGSQTFAGNKTFNNNVSVVGNLTVDTNSLFVDATSGNIGMGTASPEFKLHVVSDGGAGAGYVSNDTYGSGAVFQGRSANGTLALPTALTTGNIIAQFSGRGYGDTGFSGTRAAVVMNAAENWTDLAQGSNINFFTTAIGTTTLAVQATLTGVGNFGLGTETPTAPFGGRVLQVHNTAGNSSLYISSAATDAAMLIFGDGSAKWHIENDLNDFFSLTQSSVAQRFTIDTSGNVGIGVYNADYRLDVQTDSLAMRIKVTDADVASATDYFNDIDANFEVGINGSAHLTNPNDAYLWQYSNNDIRLGTNNIERLLIAADGNIFVGNGSVNAAPNAGFIQGTGSSTAGTIGGVLTIGGGAGATATTGSAGGGLNLQGGNAGGSGNNNGGSVAIAGGTSTGTTGQIGSVDIQAAGGNVNIGGNGNGALVSWTTNSPALPATRADAGIVTYNGYVYVFGGSAGGAFDSPITTVHYAKLNANGSIGTWNTTSPMAGARQEFGFTVANGYVYAFGGNSGSYLSPTPTNTVQFARIKADGTLDTWQTTTNLPATRRLPSATSANGYVYVVGGTGGATSVYVGKVNIDGTITSWSNPNPLSAGRESAGVAVANGYLYVIGGANSSSTPQTNVWYSKLDSSNGNNAAFVTTETDTLPVARADAEVVVMNGQIYVLGGQNGSAVSTTYYAPMNGDGTINAWTTNSAPITGARYGHMSVAANGYVYVMGGINGGSGQSTIYYASIQRVRMAGAIDLLGISGENLAEGGSAAMLTAGNTLISGTLQVTDTASIAGSVTIGRELNVGGSAYVRASSADAVGMTVQGASGQTADLMQLKDGTGAVVAKFLADGTALFGNAASCGVASTLICIDESRIELKNNGGNNSTQIIQNSNGPLEFSNGPNSGTTFAGVLVKGDKTTAFQIQNGSSQAIFTADTVNSQLLTSNISPLTAASTTTNKVTNIASTNNVGWYTSVKIGKDGFARIVYYDSTDGDLEYVRCTNYDCSTSTTTTIDSTGDVGLDAKIAIGTDGLARIAYQDFTNTSVKYAVCNDDNCSAPTINTIDNTATDTGARVNLALNSSNLARMTYYQFNSTGPVGALRFAECTVDACTSANFTNIDATTAGSYSGLALGADGFARIAYAENNNNDLAYVRCLNASCSSTSTPVIIDATADNTGYVYGIVLDRNGNAMIPYHDNTGLDLEFIRCNDVDCTTRSTTTLDSTGSVGSYNSVALGADGFARIAYYDFTNKDLKYVTCQSLDCVTNSISTLEGTGVPVDVGSDTSVAIRPDGRAVITYHDVGNGDLRMMQPSYSEGLAIGGAGNRFARLFVADAEVTSTLRIGDTSNGINFSATNGFRLSGTARNSNIATLKPEYEGATFRGDGATNIGTLNSGFCSNEAGFAINTGACNTGEDHSYYEWTHNETTDQDYDIIVRYRIPDNFDSAEAFSNHAAIRGFASKSAASTDNSVTLALYNDRGAQCGATTNITNGTANQWGSGVVLGSISGDGDCDDIDAGEYVTFVIHMTANSTGTTGEIIRMGEIEISYKSTY